MAIDGAGNAAFGFAASSSSIYGGAYYTVRAPGDAAGTVQATETLFAGVAPYVRTFGGTRNRWGDYSAMSVDANDQFWAYNEYAMATGTAFGGEDGRWATRWGAFAFN